ncbi:hypothetical protein DUI87_02144 [Hirundo rustica rustica]|uniref:Uncharacterized protein n=1 Tax=Hirundo rustica rustica TaxID=333673 RepID=A0A3M0L7H5_HIRRU|nr:hypothetical protein DUI87_02144 [Hirundo rustica rustica]
MLDFVLTNKEGLVGTVKLKSSLGCSDHEMVEFKILGAVRRSHSNSGLQKTDFGLFRDLLVRVPWDKTLKRRGAQEIWLMFKDLLLQAQERCIPTKRKSGKNTRRPVWMNKLLLEKLKHKKEAYRGHSQGQAVGQKLFDIAQSGDADASKHLATWGFIMATLKETHTEARPLTASGTDAPGPSAPTAAIPDILGNPDVKLSPTVMLDFDGNPEPGGPFDPGPMDPDQEADFLEVFQNGHKGLISLRDLSGNLYVPYS